MPEPTLTPFEQAEKTLRGLADCIHLDNILREAENIPNSEDKALALELIAELILQKTEVIAEA